VHSAGSIFTFFKPANFTAHAFTRNQGKAMVRSFSISALGSVYDDVDVAQKNL
jgi:hypothetical protein